MHFKIFQYEKEKTLMVNLLFFLIYAQFADYFVLTKETIQIHIQLFFLT